ncbi:hypothetical protein EVA_13808, partial [gut metagenome]
EVFLNDLISKLIQALKDTHDDPEFISQRKAYKMFGKGNIERWRRQGKIESYKRPGKIEYKTIELRVLQRATQDYLDKLPHAAVSTTKKVIKSKE